MCMLPKYINLRNYKDDFEKLQVIGYKSISVSNIQIRVLGIHFMNVNSDWCVNKHSHTFFEFHYVTDNYVYTKINNTENKISSGGFYLMPPGTLHSHRQDEGCGHMGFALRWEFIENGGISNPCDGIIDSFSSTVKKLFEAHSDPIPDDGRVIKGMVSLLENIRNNSCVVVTLLEFCKFIILISQCYFDQNTKAINEDNSSYLENQIVNSAMKFIEENFYQEINVYDVSNSVHLSYSQLSRLFKKHTDETIICYLNKTRLCKAQYLLKCTNKSILQIASEVGFISKQYFCTAFKKLFKVTPSIYRKSKSTLCQ